MERILSDAPGAYYASIAQHTHTAKQKNIYTWDAYNPAKSSFIFSCREYSGMLSTVATRGAVAFFVRPLGEEISAPVSPCCHSRAQILRLIRRIPIYPIYNTCSPSDVETTRRRFAQLNTIRSVLCFSILFFFPLFLFNCCFTVSPRVRSIDVYDAARSRRAFLFFMPLESLRD